MESNGITGAAFINYLGSGVAEAYAEIWGGEISVRSNPKHTFLVVDYFEDIGGGGQGGTGG